MSWSHLNPIFGSILSLFWATLSRSNAFHCHDTELDCDCAVYILQFVGAIALAWTLLDQTKYPVLYEQFMRDQNAAFLVGNTAAPAVRDANYKDRHNTNGDKSLANDMVAAQVRRLDAHVAVVHRVAQDCVRNERR